MYPQIDVKFARMPHDPSVEASVQRWVDRIGWANVEIMRASVTIERTGWRRISVCLTVVLAGGGKALSTAISHTDIYVAVADVFREVRKQVLGRADCRSLAFTG
jgi:ribosome-associated translation inhibitor RaiA